nr:amidohydrolase family protein [Burkholderia ambifaria]
MNSNSNASPEQAIDRLLIKGGQLITMVPGTVEQTGDILVENGRIARIGGTFEATGARVIDATGMIVLPGFVDTHRHVWQTQLRTVASDWSLFDYLARIRLGYSRFYSPEDAYIGNLVGALEALNAGITTVVDHCHIINSPQHADRAVQGLKDAGIRAIFCYGLFANPSVANPDAWISGPEWRIDDLQRVRQDLFSDDEANVTFGVAPSEAEAVPFEVVAHEIELARSLGAKRISYHVAMGAYDRGSRVVERLGDAGLLGPDLLFVHGAALTDRELDLLRDCGAGLCATPETEMQMGMGFPVAFRALRSGVNASLGIDIVSNYTGEMFSQMRLALQSARALENSRYQEAKVAPRRITPLTREALALATRGGAAASGLSHSIGTLESGKKADIVMIRTDSIHMCPSTDPIGAVVLNASVSDVDTVLVGGKVVKQGGILTCVNWSELANRLRLSASRIHHEFATLDIRQLESAFEPFLPLAEL